MAYESLNYTNPSSGATVATDIVSGLYVQIVKLDFGADGQSSPVIGAMPTSVADGLDIALGATTDAEAASGNGSLIAILKRLRTLTAGGLPAALIGGRLDVNVGNTPTVTIGSQPIHVVPDAGTFPISGSVSLLTSPVHIVPDAGTFPISGNVGLNAGSNTIGKVDQGTAGASAWKVDGSAVNQPIVPAAGTFPISGSVSLLTSPVHVVPDAGTFPISGTVTANQGTNPWVCDTELPAAAALSDAGANPTAPAVGAFGEFWNDENTVWQRARDSTRLTLLASGARTATADSAAIAAYNYRRLALIVNVTANTGGIKQTPSLQIQDVITGNWVTVWTAPANITAQGTFSYYFADGASGGGGSAWTAVASFGIAGATLRFEMVAGNGNSVTYSVSAHPMV